MQSDEHTAVVTGCADGLGLLLTSFLLAAGWHVIGWSTEEEFTLPSAAQAWDDHFTYQRVDVQWLDDIVAAVAELDQEIRVDVLINCASSRFPRPFESIDFREWEQQLDVNAKAIAMTTRALLPLMANPSDPMSAGTVCNIVGSAARVPAVHLLAYSASKAAALMVSRQMARELFKSHGLTVFSVSPNESGECPPGMDTDPGMMAEFIGFLLSKKERHIYLHGCDIPYGA